VNFTGDIFKGYGIKRQRRKKALKVKLDILRDSTKRILKKE
jgi:hypothetical protein